MKTKLKVLQYISFMSIGIIGNIIGPLLPTIKDEINLSYSQSGLLLSELFIGMLISGLVGGYVMGKINKMNFLLLGNIFLLIGLLGSFFSRSYSFLFSMNFFTALGFGIFTVGINSLAADLSGENKGNDMNVLHFFYGIGAISGPILVLLCTNYIVNWRLSFVLGMVLPAISTFMLIRHGNVNQISAKPSLGIKNSNNSLPLKSLMLWVAGFAIFFYVGVETATAGWIPEFWSQTNSSNWLPPSLATTVFWFSITFGRLFTGKIADAIGLIKFIAIASLGSLVVSIAWLLIPAGPWTLINIILIGIFLSGLYPNIMAHSTASFPKKTGVVAAFISVFGSLGGFLIPTLIGKLSDSYGIKTLAISIFVASALMAVFCTMLWKTSKA